MRHAKLYKRLLVGTVVLLGLFCAADIVVLQVAESQGGNGIAQATAAERASVDLGGFPFLPNLFAGRLARVRVEAVGLSGGGLRIAMLEASITDLRFSSGQAFALINSPHAGKTKITGTNLSSFATIIEKDLAEYLHARVPEIQEVKVLSTGVEVTFLLPDGKTSPAVRFLPRVQNQRLVLALVGLTGVPPGFHDRARSLEAAIQLPPIPKGLRIDPSLGRGSIVLEASSPKITLVAGEGGLRSVEPSAS